MRCPKCNSSLRESKKAPGYYLCDSCKKRYPARLVLPDEPIVPEEPDEDTDDFSQMSLDDYMDLDTPAPVADTRVIPAKAGRPAQRDSAGVPAKASRPQRPARPQQRKPAPTRRSSPRYDDDVYDYDEPVNYRSSSSKKKKTSGKLPFYILIAVLILLVFAGVFILGKKGKLPFGKKDDAAVAEQTETQTTFKQGEAASGNNVTLVMNGYEESTGDDMYHPEEGKVFVFVDMALTNNSAQDVILDCMGNFTGLLNGEKLEYSQNAFSALTDTTDKVPMHGSVPVGGIFTGYYCMEVPADWTSLQITYADKAWSPDVLTFVIEKQVQQ